MVIIEAENLKKDFKRRKRKDGFVNGVKSLFCPQYEVKTAVDGISFQIEKGEMIGYIGPNGAGKSTSIKMMAGVLVPTGGKVLVNGMVPSGNRVENARKIGVVFGQKTQLWWDTPVIESLRLMKYLYDIPERQFEQNMALFSDILGLKEFERVAVRSLSLGQRMRADLCAAMLHNPEILYLDEPTIGLDVVVKEKIREFIRQVNQERMTTMILTTHDMSDIEKLCSRVMVIDRGKLMYDGSLAKLKQQYGNEETLILETDGGLPAGTIELPGILSCCVENGKTKITYEKRAVNSTAVLKWFMDRCSVLDFQVKETDIEEIIRKMYLQAPSYLPEREEGKD